MKKFYKKEPVPIKTGRDIYYKLSNVNLISPGMLLKRCYILLFVNA